MKNTEIISISVPISWLQIVDRERGDVSRSLFIRKLVEKAHGGKVKNV